MLAVMFLVASGIGLIIGRLYSFVAAVLVSPLLWLASVMASLSLGRPLGQSCVVGLGCVFALDTAFLAGAGLRLWSIGRADARRQAVAPQRYAAAEDNASSRSGRR